MICKRCNDKESRSVKSHYCKDCYVLVRKESNKKYHMVNKESRNNSCKEYKIKNKEHIKDYNKNYTSENSAILSEKRKEKRKENSEILNLQSKEWRINNKDKVKEYSRKHTPLYRKKYPWLQACRNLITNTISRIGTKKEDNTIKLLNYSSIDLKLHLESRFSDGMSWDNYGEWHIDHIRPVSDFPSETPPCVINSLNNLQPLWKIDNLKKGKKMSF